MVADLHTSRLLLTPTVLEDAEQIQELFPHWEIVRYLNTRIPWPYPPDGAYTHIRDVVIPDMAAGKNWQWSIRLKTDPTQLIGVINLMTSERNNRGFWIGIPWQGQRLMTEAAATATDYWFDVLRFDASRVTKAAANVASRRISERQGMRVVGHVEGEYISGRFPAEQWEITADEWRRAKTRFHEGTG